MLLLFSSLVFWFLCSGICFFIMGGHGCMEGATLEKLCGKILCGEYYNLVSLLAHNFSAAGTLPSYRYDYMLFSYFLEGRCVK